MFISEVGIYERKILKKERKQAFNKGKNKIQGKKRKQTNDQEIKVSKISTTLSTKKKSKF